MMTPIRVPANRPDHVRDVLVAQGMSDRKARTLLTVRRPVSDRDFALMSSTPRNGEVATEENWYRPVEIGSDALVYDRATVEQVMAEHGMEWHAAKKWFFAAMEVRRHRLEPAQDALVARRAFVALGCDPQPCGIGYYGSVACVRMADGRCVEVSL